MDEQQSPDDLESQAQPAPVTRVKRHWSWMGNNMAMPAPPMGMDRRKSRVVNMAGDGIRFLTALPMEGTRRIGVFLNAKLSNADQFRMHVERNEFPQAQELLVRVVNDRFNSAGLPVADCLHSLCEKGQPELVELLLTEIKANVNVQDDVTGQSALDIAVQHSFPELVRVLASNGADLDNCPLGGDPPLVRAALVVDMPICTALLESKANPNRAGAGGRTALMVAASKGQGTLAEVLVQSAADVNQCDERGRLPAACALECENATELLLAVTAEGFDFKAQMVTQVLDACIQREDQRGVEYLLGHDASPNIPFADCTLLERAIEVKHEGITLTLLQAHASHEVEFTDGQPVLLHAAKKASGNVVKVLCDLKCDPAVADSKGWTPLMWAARVGQLESLRALEKQLAGLPSAPT